MRCDPPAQVDAEIVVHRPVFAPSLWELIDTSIYGVMHVDIVCTQWQTHDIRCRPEYATVVGGARKLPGCRAPSSGCGMALCGACTVHLDGQAIRSCVLQLSAVAGRQVTTIEGLQSVAAKAVQAAWIELQVPQCGYCQSGQVMSATALLEKNASPSDADIDGAMSGNICRCATYSRIRAAIHVAAQSIKATA